MNVFFILLLCEKKLCDCRSGKKMMSLIMKEMLIVSSILKKTTTIKSFLNKV